jgi:hypothetical protein
MVFANVEKSMNVTKIVVSHMSCTVRTLMIRISSLKAIFTELMFWSGMKNCRRANRFEEISLIIAREIGYLSGDVLRTAVRMEGVITLIYVTTRHTTTVQTDAKMDGVSEKKVPAMSEVVSTNLVIRSRKEMDVIPARVPKKVSRARKCTVKILPNRILLIQNILRT